MPFQLDASIPANAGGPARFNTPFDGLRQAYDLRGAQQDAEVRRQQIASAKALEDERRQKLDHQNALSDALKAATSDGQITRDGLQQAYVTAGLDPMPVLKEFDEGTKRLQDLSDSRRKAAKEEADFIAEQAAANARNGYDLNDMAVRVKAMKQGGIDVGPFLEALPQADTPEKYKALVDHLAQSNKQQELTNQTGAEARAQQKFDKIELPAAPNPQTGLTPDQTRMQDAQKKTDEREQQRIELEKRRVDLEAKRLSLSGGSAQDPDTVAAYARMVQQNGTLVDVPAAGGMRNAVIKALGQSGVDVQKLTAADISRKNIAKTILPKFESVSQMARDIDKMGLTGTLGGRWRKLVSGETAASDLAGLTPEQKQLVGRFASEASGLLLSGIAMAHGGARGGGSPQLLEQVKQYLDPGNKDLDVYLGNLQGAKDFINGYAHMGEADSAGASDKTQKVVTQAQIEAVAKKNGTTPEQERKRATAEGYVIR